MNRLLIKTLLAMTLLITGSVRAAADYNPTDPPEPNQIIKANVTVSANPAGMGYTSGTGRYLMGTVVTVSTSSAVANWKFTGWLMDGEEDTSHTSSSFQYTVGEEDVAFTAIYEYVTPVEPEDPDEPDPEDPILPPYDPTNPDEPETPEFSDETEEPDEPQTPPVVESKYVLTIVSEPFDGCSFNLSSGNKYTAGTRVSLNASGNQGFVFNGWYDDESTLLSEINPFVYTMPERDVSVIAKWTYCPDSPEDPFGPLPEDVIVPGDANGDYKVTIADVMSAISHTLGNTPANFSLTSADLNNDGQITIIDIMMLIDMVSAF